MKTNIYILPLLLAFVLLSACESKEAYNLPSVEDEFIRLEMGEEQHELKALGRTYYRFVEGDRPVDELLIGRKATDGSHELHLRLYDARLNQRLLPKAYGEDEAPALAETVEITYTAYEFNNDPYCPHLEGIPTVLNGSIYVESWNEDGMMTGTFRSMDHGPYQLKGKFSVRVPRR